MIKTAQILRNEAMESLYLSMSKEAYMAPILKGLANVFTKSKYLSGASQAFTKGNKQGWDYLAGFGGHKITGTGKNLSTSATQKTTGNMLGDMFAGGIGDSVQFYQSMAKNVVKGDSPLLNIGRAARDTSKHLYDQVRSSRYRIVDPKNPGTNSFYQGSNTLYKGKDGKDYLKSQGLFKPFGDRAAVGTTKDGKLIFKKRVPMQAVAMGTTPVGFGVTMGALEPGSTTQKVKAGLGETFMWGGTRPIADAKLFGDLGASLFK